MKLASGYVLYLRPDGAIVRGGIARSDDFAKIPNVEETRNSVNLHHESVNLY